MSIQAIVWKAAVLTLSLCGMAPAADRWGDHLSENDTKVAWPVFRAAILDFQKNGDRPALLKTCKELLANDPATGYAEPLRGLIEPLEREAVQGDSPFLKTPTEKRTAEENIRFWIYQLRTVGGSPSSGPGHPMIFALPGRPRTPVDELVEIGVPTIPFLLAALDDDTPTQTILWQREFYPIYFVLRRQDLAMMCLEHITACQFYHEGATFIHLYMDAPERRKSAIDNAKAWWQESEGQTQAQGIRNQLRLRQQNITLRGYDRIAALQMFAALEGPEGVLDELHEMSVRDAYGLNSPIQEALEQIDRPYLVQEALRRFWDNASRKGDYHVLLRYGDVKVYQEMTKRFQESHTLDTSGWGLGGQGEWAAKYGLNWSIPLLAELLTHTKMTGSRGAATGSQSFSNADMIIEPFQRLTGYDAGYDKNASEEDRLVAIKKARTWWLEKGREALAEKIREDHPPVLPIGDLLMTDEECAALQAKLTGADAAARHKAIAELTSVYAPKTQRALLSALEKEDDPVERRRILEILKAVPEAWYLPTLGKIFATDKDVPLRLLAGEILLAQFQYDRSMATPRLETRSQALGEVSRVVADANTPQAVREIGVEILKDRVKQSRK